MKFELKKKKKKKKFFIQFNSNIMSVKIKNSII